MRRIEKLETFLAISEGGWVQLTIGRRIVWLTNDAYGHCYVSLDAAAKGRIDDALQISSRDRFDLATLREMAQ